MKADTEQTIDLGSHALTKEWVQSYLVAVGDDLSVYEESGLAPPLALCAWALGAMLEKLSLPAGTIHSIQEMEAVAAVSMGSTVRGVAERERPRTRGGLSFVSVSYSIEDDSGNLVQRGKTTVLTPTSDGGDGNS